HKSSPDENVPTGAATDGERRWGECMTGGQSSLERAALSGVSVEQIPGAAIILEELCVAVRIPDRIAPVVAGLLIEGGEIRTNVRAPVLYIHLGGPAMSRIAPAAGGRIGERDAGDDVVMQ